jgi:hypothetical protein
MQRALIYGGEESPHRTNYSTMYRETPLSSRSCFTFGKKLDSNNPRQIVIFLSPHTANTAFPAPNKIPARDKS